MSSLHEIALYIGKYGYVIIFLLVFLQELGIPNPITNELVLMFSGYLSYTHRLTLLKVVAVAITADFTGTSILFFVFYFFGKRIIAHKPKWLPLRISTIDKLKLYVNKRGLWSIYVGRLIPFMRGYISVVAGILHIKPQKFITIVILSAITWSGGLVLLGRVFAPYWNIVIRKVGIVENIALLVLFIVSILLTSRYLIRKHTK